MYGSHRIFKYKYFSLTYKPALLIFILIFENQFKPYV
jgi:hypothetical protein